MTTALGYRSYAKLNLYLDVLNKRDDGYHNIETVFQTIDLGDDLFFAEQHSGITLSCTSKDIETGEDNLVHRAAALLARRFECRQGVHIELQKRIPVAAGLAGGSGDAAATLIALNRLWSLGLTTEELQALALELGSDVPYCVVGGAMCARSRGEILEPLPGLPTMAFVLLHPALAVSTSRVYQDPRLQRGSAPGLDGFSEPFTDAVAALKRGDFGGGIFNRMEGVVFQDQPALARLKDRLIDAGCSAAAMSGSGPTLFGVCDSKRKADEVAARFREIETSVVRSVNVGVERI